MNEAKNSVTNSTEMVAIPLVKLDNLIDAVEQMKAGKLRPFMYAIQGPDGEAHIDENCVAGDPATLAIEVNGLNDSPDAGYQIVPVYLGAQPVQQPAPVADMALPGCLADRLYEAISIARDRAQHAGSPPRMRKWDATRADLRAALAAPVAAPVAGQEPAKLDTDQSREYLVRFMEQHFTDKTYHRYIRGGREQNNLAGDFAWQMARALRMIIAPAASTPPAQITLTGHQLRIALDLINPDGPSDRDQLDDDLTFGVRQHQDDDGKVSTGMCCWNEDSDGVLPLDGEYEAPKEPRE